MTCFCAKETKARHCKIETLPQFFLKVVRILHKKRTTEKKYFFFFHRVSVNHFQNHNHKDFLLVGRELGTKKPICSKKVIVIVCCAEDDATKQKKKNKKKQKHKKSWNTITPGIGLFFLFFPLEMYFYLVTQRIFIQKIRLFREANSKV